MSHEHHCTGFGQAVAAYRQEHKLSQKALADKVGLSQPMIAALELGRRIASPPTARKLIDALGMPAHFEACAGTEHLVHLIAVRDGSSRAEAARWLLDHVKDVPRYATFEDAQAAHAASTP